MSVNPGWKAAKIQDIPPLKDSFMKGWHSVRHHLDIRAFGVNAVTVGKGEELVKAHDEAQSLQQELFVILSGRAEFVLNGQTVKAVPGTAIAVEPEVLRSAVALESPTSVLIIGAKPGEIYEPPRWDK
jgi:quercetin dioxygenase-like cupin family protein